VHALGAPEIRSEVDHLAEWTTGDVEELQKRRIARTERTAER